ncbi:hypothetical protein ColTof4_01514 [Colletotrichum tofieldiae]|nr:hypothetical protein ColTof4_01514 [Colletotrichum tofieldiae]GKT96619.1 hypothetical protein Ct61P_14469 [Colletotrichum tofieldiae]
MAIIIGLAFAVVPAPPSNLKQSSPVRSGLASPFVQYYHPTTGSRGTRLCISALPVQLPAESRTKP